MKFLLKRVESVFYFALVLFAFPCFATEVYEGGEVTECHFDPTTMQRFLRYTTGTGCSSGEMCVERLVRQGGRGSSPKLMDICLPPENLCPAGSTLDGNVCKCNDGDYEFPVTDNDSCSCLDGTAKPRGGSCSSTCPSGSSAVNRGGVNKCACSYNCSNGCGSFTVDIFLNSLCPDSPTPPASACQCPTSCPIGPDGKECPLNSKTGDCDCSYPCPDSPCNATFVHSITPSSSPVAPSAHPDPNAPIPPASTCQCPATNKCASEEGWDPRNEYAATHSEISLGPPVDVNDPARCPEGSILKDALLHTAYCEKDQECSSEDEDEVECTNQKTPINYGPCQQAIVWKTVYIFESNIADEPGYPCPDDWREYKTTKPTSHTACMSSDRVNIIIIDTPSDRSTGSGKRIKVKRPYIKLDVDQHGRHNRPDPNCRSGVTKVKIGKYELCAHPVSSSEINADDLIEGGEYTCPDRGAPSSQSASCECQATVTEEGCGGDYIRQADVTPGACNCPDASWDLDNRKCSKAPEPDTTTVTVKKCNYHNDDVIKRELQQSEPDTDMDNLKVMFGVLGRTTTVPTIHLAGDECTETTTIKTCKVGRYNTSTQKCEMFCIQESNIQNCKCVKDIVGNRCDCPVGWIQNDTKCRRLAEPVQKKCICECDPKTKRKYLEFQVGDEMDLAIKADFSKCVEYDENDPDKCGTPKKECCDESANPSVYYDECPVNPIVSPYKPGPCPLCPDGNKVPVSPGGCCANGKAVNNLRQCTTHIGGDPKGIDIAFRGNSSYFYSVYSTGSMDRPDYICWRRITTGGSGYQKVQMRELVCPSKDDCGGKARDPITKMCQCQSLDASDNVISHEKTYCEYASRDPMRFEDGIVRGDVPSSRENDKYHTDIRFFKTNIIATPGGR